MDEDQELQEKKEREESRKIARQQALDDIGFILHFPQGVRFFKRLAREAKPFGCDYRQNDREHAFYSGHKNALLKILADAAEADPANITRILVEGVDSVGISDINQAKEQ